MCGRIPSAVGQLIAWLYLCKSDAAAAPKDRAERGAGEGEGVAFSSAFYNIFISFKQAKQAQRSAAHSTL